ncbi:MAG: shikimate kinase [Lentisphaeria bacterium]
MRIVLTGCKGSGKSTIGRELAVLLKMHPVETDNLIESLFEKQQGKPASCREICRTRGEKYFRQLECRAVKQSLQSDNCVICTGGQTLMNDDSRRELSRQGTIVLLTVNFETTWQRVKARGIPPFMPADNPREWFKERVEKINQVIEKVAHLKIDVTGTTPRRAAQTIATQISPALFQR